MTTSPIHQWYLSFKADAACLTCQHENLPYQLGKVEFHHIDPEAKCDTLSNMAFLSRVFPERHPVKPVDFAAEVNKVCPLCPDHHRDLHRAIDKGDDTKLASLYNFNDPFYTNRIRAFRQHALDIAPPELKDQIYDGLWQKLDSNPYALTGHHAPIHR